MLQFDRKTIPPHTQRWHVAKQCESCFSTFVAYIKSVSQAQNSKTDEVRSASKLWRAAEASKDCSVWNSWDHSGHICWQQPTLHHVQWDLWQDGKRVCWRNWDWMLCCVFQHWRFDNSTHYLSRFQSQQVPLPADLTPVCFINSLLHANLHNLHHRKLTNSLKIIVRCKTYWPQVSDESLLPWPSPTQLNSTVVLTSWSNFCFQVLIVKWTPHLPQLSSTQSFLPRTHLDYSMVFRNRNFLHWFTFPGVP